MGATTPAEADGPATIPELDDDALLAICMHLPAPTLMTAMLCSRGWRNIVRHSDVLWRQKLLTALLGADWLLPVPSQRASLLTPE